MSNVSPQLMQRIRQDVQSMHAYAIQDSVGMVKLDAMEKEADARLPGREERRHAFNEMLRRHVMGLDYNPSPLVDKALSASSAWMLLTSPAYFLTNATQPFVMSLPTLAGKHGYGKSFAAMSKAYNDIFPLLKDGQLTQDDYSKMPADVRSVIEALADRGRIDITLEQDLGNWRSTEDSKLQSLGWAMGKLRGVTQINVLDTLGLISASFGDWEGVPGGDHVELTEKAAGRHLSLQFKDDVLVGCNSVGWTDHVGVMRGLVEGRVPLGEWKDRLMADPTQLMHAYLASAQAQGQWSGAASRVDAGTAQGLNRDADLRAAGGLAVPGAGRQPGEVAGPAATAAGVGCLNFAPLVLNRYLGQRRANTRSRDTLFSLPWCGSFKPVRARRLPGSGSVW